MLNWLRRQKKWVYIIMVFAMAAWGIGYSASYLIPQKPAGVILGEKVSQEEFNDALARWHRVFFRDRDLPLVKLVWEQLTLAREAERMGIVVTYEEVLERLQAMAITMLGHTTNIPAEQMLPVLCQNYSVTEEQLIRTFREALLSEKMHLLLVSAVKVSTEEAWQKYAKENEEVKVEFLALRARDIMEDVGITEDELTSFYNKYKDTFPNPAQGIPGYKEPEKIKIEYVMARYSDAEKTVTVTDEEIKSYYEENKERRFKIEEEKKTAEAKETKPAAYKPFDAVKEEIRQVLTRTRVKDVVDKLISQADEKIYESLGKTENISLPGLAKELGIFYKETDYFTKAEATGIIKNAEERVYSTFFEREENDPSPPLDSPAGKFIFQVLSRKEPSAPPLEAIRKKVEEDLREEKALLKAEELAKLCIEKTRASSFDEGVKSLEEGSKRLKEGKPFYQRGETEFFSRPEPVEGKPYRFVQALDADVPNLAAMAFSLKVNEVAMVTEKTGKKACYVIRLLNRKEAEHKNFADNKEKLRRRYTMEKQQDFLAQWSKRLKEKATFTR